ncbi:MAG: SpoIVB peptidase [Oscillospiraceae bacterium]|nr:SpoIVB peptidase [Oscillospiraceae bacterium]
MNETKRRHSLRRCVAALCAMLFFAFALGASTVRALGEEAVRVVPVGRAVGVKLFADGVLVVGLSDGETAAKDVGLREGDILLTFNGTQIDSSEHLRKLIAENGDARATLNVQRGAKMLSLDVTPQRDAEGACHLGAWIRDSMAGIGTMTFYDPQSGAFGALGHGVTDVDTGALMPLQSGSIMDASVKAVKKGIRGDPGELRGEFDLTRDCGTLSANTDCGIFGVIAEPDEALRSSAALPVAPQEEIHTGKATILANCSGTEVREYAIEIEKIYHGAQPARNLLLRVTDEALLDTTGGIVQGMSGSPILQDGKLIGAVTHVLVNDATRGYGIFIENMLQAADLSA